MILDILIIIFTALTFYIGYNNGILGVSLKIILFFVCIFLALKLFPFVFLFLENTFSEPSQFLFAAGFILVLICLILLFRFTSRLINRTVARTSMRLITKISGGVILSFFLVVLICFVIGQLNTLKLTKEEHYSESLLYPGLKKVDEGLSTVINQVQESFNNSFERNIKTINEMEKSQKQDTMN